MASLKVWSGQQLLQTSYLKNFEIKDRPAHLLAAIRTCAPCFKNSRARGSMPSTTSDPALSLRNGTRK